MPFVEFVSDAYEAATDADVVVLVTEWNEFRQLDTDRLSKVMAGRVIVDCRNIYDPEAFESAGFRYVGVGRGKRAKK